ncbi:hypothetical protein E1176_15730 [Fulvivirga sp. RKSG066]|uniref:Cbp1 family collagen-binding glycoprotein adhesin n=1 Tax=Fulvivirga aurantia TaxID=2529383 RepID=UPI0012BD5DDE|nr:hypothetical protein [Fulvivirga aurantia]MTI22482.1 hypothetical protein [Fulvivirga aurantia]
MKVTSLLFAVLLVIASCGESIEKKENIALKEEIGKLKAENDSLRSGELKLQASLAESEKFLKEIEQNLASVDENKTMLAKLSGENQEQEDVQADIKNHIEKIKELMENSKLKVISLDKSLTKLRKESGDKSAEILALDNQVKAMVDNLIAKDKEIEALDSELESVENMYELELENSAELTAILNRAYYLVASSKDLEAQGIITKEGGFIGLGKVKVINANAPDSLFVQVEKNKIEEVMINAKKATIITNHPADSYTIEGEGKAEKLLITNQELFWKEGNYLVIAIEK